MTDPFDFESKFESRLSAHAARASRPFDAALVATAAASTSSRGVAFGPLARSLSGRDGRLSTVRVAVTVLLLAAVVTAGAILVGAALRGQPPLPDQLAVVPPTESAEPTHILEDRPTPVPEETPPTSTPQAVPATPVPSTNQLLYTDQGPKRCGTRVHSIDITTGTTSQPIAGCFLTVRVAPDGRHVLAGGGTGYDTGDGIGIVKPADQDRFTIVDLSTGTGPDIRSAQLARFGWSPDGRWVAHDGVVGPADGSSWTALPRPLSTGSTCAPCWSPDGSYLAFRTDDGLVIGEGSGAGMHLVATMPAIWSWSQNGRRVAFVRDGDAWVANVDGSNVRNITTFEHGAAAGVAISPDGTKIAVHTGLRTMWVVDPDGARGPFDLGSAFLDGQVMMRWSADSRWLAVSAPLPDAPATGTTVVMTSYGSVVARVAASHVAWAPDGSRVAISVSPWDLDPQSTTGKTPNARGTTYLVAADGSQVKLDDAWSVAWKPDSGSFAFVSGDPKSPKLEVAGADGSGRRVLPTGPIPGVGDLTWMP